jgi:hypothetical protein
MATPEITQPVDYPRPSPQRACLTIDCSCKDARIVSLRRAAFFAAIARQRGETASRLISPEPDWAIPQAFEAAVDDLVLADVGSRAEAVASGDDNGLNALSERIDR